MNSQGGGQVQFLSFLTFSQGRVSRQLHFAIILALAEETPILIRKLKMKGGEMVTASDAARKI